MFGGCFGQCGLDRAHDMHPEVGHHPNMRVVLALVVLVPDQQVFRHRFADGDDIAPPGQLVHEFLHLRFEIEAVPEHEIGLGHGEDVGARLTIGMRIDTRPHQRLHIDQLAAHLSNGVGDHAGRGDHSDRGGLGPQRTCRQRSGGQHKAKNASARGLHRTYS